MGSALIPPREPVAPALDLPAGAAEPERELGETHRDVRLGVLAEKAVEIVGLEADAPLDLRRVPPDLVAPAAERRDLRLEFGGPVREERVPAIRVAGNESQRPP